MGINRKVFLLFCAVVIACVVVVAVSVLRLPGPRKRTEYTFRLSKCPWAPWDAFQMGVQRLEKRVGRYRTEFVRTDDLVSALRLVEEGEVHGATLTIYEAIQAAARGVHLRIVLLLDYTVGSDGIVVHKGIDSLLDLKGRRIGVKEGTISHFTLLKALEKGGISQGEVELIDLGLEQLKEAFVTGQVDAVATYEPYLGRLVAAGDGRVIFSSREIPRAICDVLFVRQEVIEQHPEVLKHWAQAWQEVLEYRLISPEDFHQDLSSLSIMSEEELTRSLEGVFLTDLLENRRAFGTEGQPGYLRESVREMARFMHREGAIGSVPSAERIVAPGVVVFPSPARER